MADNEEVEAKTSHGAEWEVVSLTASAYAAAPGPKQVELNEDFKENIVEADQAETSRALLMSSHFVFPPSQHENLPLEPETIEIQNVQGGEDDVPEIDTEQVDRSDMMDEKNCNAKALTMEDEFSRLLLFDEKGNRLPIHSQEFEEEVALQAINLVTEESSMYGSKVSSLHSEMTTGGSTMFSETSVIPEPINPSEGSFDSSISQLAKHVKDDNYDGSELPCQAWWKRQAVSLYTQAKEANAFWSIFIAAAVMGLVILGQHWQQERWQALQLKLQFSINDKKMVRMLGCPISRFKDVIVGGNLRGSFIMGSSSTRR